MRLRALLLGSYLLLAGCSAFKGFFTVAGSCSTVADCDPLCDGGLCVNIQCSGGFCVPCAAGEAYCRCDGTKEGETNCGTCATTCVVATAGCDGGDCGCGVGQISCDGICVSNDTSSHCGGCAPCATGATCQSGECVCPGAAACEINGQSICTDTARDPDNCGGCGLSCPSGVCCGGACAVEGDVNNCGMCGATCATTDHATPVCTDGQCGEKCSSPNTSCGGKCLSPKGVACGVDTDCCTGQCCGAFCADVNTDPANCGSCGYQCPITGSTCSGGSCACPAGQTPCAGACVACPASGSCSQTACTCPTGQMECGGSCVATDSTAHCGGCAACTGASVCTGGTMCTCPAGAMMCGGVCVANDVQNCGACGNECASGSTCNGTECVCAVNNASGMTPVVCAAPANACFSDACAHDADCCLGVCDGNVCCARPGSPCSSAEDCGDSSGKDVCASSPSQDHLQCGSNNQCCVGHYGSCGANSDCCSSYSCVAGYCLL